MPSLCIKRVKIPSLCTKIWYELKTNSVKEIQRIMMKDLSTIFAPSFVSKLQDKSHIVSTNLKGWMNAEREKIFINPNHINTKIVEHNLNIKAKLYLVYFRSVSAIIGYYPQENKVLWLDHHRNNEDFNKFALQENLCTWLPNNVDNFVDLLIQTKFHFLGEPFYIKAATDIPILPVVFRNHILSSEEGVKEITRRENLFKEISTKMHPPKCSKKNRFFFINFYVWTRICGRIINISCSIGSDGIFSYQGNELGEGLGHFYVPR